MAGSPTPTDGALHFPVVPPPQREPPKWPAPLPSSNGVRSRILDGYNEDSGTWTDEPQGDHYRGYAVPRVLAALQMGTSMTSAASWGRVTFTTITRWRDKGRMLAATVDGLGDNDEWRERISFEDRVYIDFALEMERAVGRLEVELATYVRAGARDDPKLALAVLSRRFPGWAEQRRIDVGSVEAMVQDDIADAISRNPAVAALAEEFTLLAAEGAIDVDSVELTDDDEP